jgi:hypothetical protein
MNRALSSKILSDDQCRVAPRCDAASGGSAMKARQVAKIGELRQALIALGYTSLDQQAGILGLCRSTTWTILKAHHKASGLRATIIKRILGAQFLPHEIERIIQEYVREKCAGAYGHGEARLRHFRAQLEQRERGTSGQH